MNFTDSMSSWVVTHASHSLIYRSTGVRTSSNEATPYARTRLDPPTGTGRRCHDSHESARDGLPCTAEPTPTTTQQRSLEIPGELR